MILCQSIAWIGNRTTGKVQRAAACYMQRSFYSLTQLPRFRICLANWGGILSSPPFNWL